MDNAAFSYCAEHNPRGWTPGFSSWRYGLGSSEEARSQPRPRVPLSYSSPLLYSKMCFFDKDCSVKILHCLLPGFGKTTSWPMLLHALRAKSVIHVSVGFDSSPPKPLSSSLLKYLGCVSIFRRLFVPSDCILVSFGYTGSFGFTYSRT